MHVEIPGLYGLSNSNRDFSDSYYWGKNQFNTSFPMAMACYMRNRGIPAVYIRHAEEFATDISEITIDDPGHPGNPVDVTKKLRCLTTRERSLIQTYPENFILVGSKTDLEQIIGNAVPVNLARHVAQALIRWIGSQANRELFPTDGQYAARMQ